MTLATQAASGGMANNDALWLALGFVALMWLFTPNKNKGGNKGKKHAHKSVPRRIKKGAIKKRRKKFGS